MGSRTRRPLILGEWALWLTYLTSILIDQSYILIEEENMLHLDYGKNKVVLEYNEAILDEPFYQNCLNRILRDIDWRMKLLDQVRDVMRKKHYSIRTEHAYITWIRQYILFHNKSHPKDLGEREVFGIHLSRIYSKRAMTSGPCRSAWGIRICQLP